MWSEQELLTSRYLHRVTSRSMNPERPSSQELWDETPAAVQDYTRTVVARVAALETVVQRLEGTAPQLTERLQQESRTSSRLHSNDPPQALGKRPPREPSGRWCQATRWTWWFPSSRSGVITVSTPCRAKTRSPSGIR